MKKAIHLSVTAALLIVISSCDSPINNITAENDSDVQSKRTESAMQLTAAYAQTDSARKATWRHFKAENGQDWKIRRSKRTGLPVSIFGGLTRKVYKGNPKQAALAFLKEYKNLFGFADRIEYEKTQQNAGVTSVAFRQYYKGVPVAGAQYKVHIRSNGRIDMVNGSFYPDVSLSASPSLSASAAVGIAKRQLNVHNPAKQGRRARLFVWPEEDGSFSLIWNVHLFTSFPNSYWVYTIDAHSGKIMREVNQLAGAVWGEAYTINYCHTPDPALVQLLNLEGNQDSLDGTYIKVYNASGPEAINGDNPPNPGFTYPETSPHFDEVMVYYHVDNFRHGFINNLEGSGHQLFNKLNGYVYSTCGIGENGCYNPGTGDIHFSSKQYSRQSKIIYHEYSHAVIDDIKNGIEHASDEEGAVYEGLPDFWAGSFSNYSVILACLPAYTRDMTNPEISSYSEYENDYNDPNSPGVEPHKGGEFFSAILWDLRSKVNTTDQLTYNALFRIDIDPTFMDFRDGLIGADHNLSGGQNYVEIRNTFASWGVGTEVPPLDVAITGPNDLQGGETGTWQANVSGGTLNHTYQWYYRNGGYAESWIADGANSPTYSHSWTFSEYPEGVAVKVVVNSGNQQKFDTYDVLITDPACGLFKICN